MAGRFGHHLDGDQESLGDPAGGRIFPAEGRTPGMMVLPEIFRNNNMTAEPCVSGSRPGLKVRGFSDIGQVKDCIETAEFGSPTRVTLSAQQQGIGKHTSNALAGAGAPGAGRTGP